jgi:hypothetical protein
MSNGPICLEFLILAIRPSSNSCNSEVVDYLESDFNILIFYLAK